MCAYRNIHAARVHKIKSRVVNEKNVRICVSSETRIVHKFTRITTFMRNVSAVYVHGIYVSCRTALPYRNGDA